MSLIIEDGTGIVGANTYADVATADAYHDLRGNAAWASASTGDKSSALVRATDFIEATYPAQEPRYVPAQGLQWPSGCHEGLPASLVQATCLLALYALNGPLSEPSTRGIKSKVIKAGPVDVETVYDDAGDVDPFPIITAMLAPISAASVGNTLIVGRLS